MPNDILSPALVASMVGSLSVPDLIRTMETFKQSGQTASIEAGYAAWIAHNQGHPLLYAVLFNYSVCLSDAGKLDEAQQLTRGHAGQGARARSVWCGGSHSLPKVNDAAR